MAGHHPKGNQSMATDAGSRLGELVAQAREAASVLTGEDKDLRPIAFERVLDHLLGNGSAQPNGITPAAHEAAPAVDSIDTSLATEQQRVDAAARYFDIDPDQVRELFDLTGDKPKLVLHSNKLATGYAAAVRQIAFLVCGIRTATGLDTGSQHIRTAAADLGKLDPPNFMTTLGNMKAIAVLGKQGSPNRAIRMRVTGAEAARPLAKKLVA